MVRFGAFSSLWLQAGERDVEVPPVRLVDLDPCQKYRRETPRYWILISPSLRTPRLRA